MFFSVDPGLRDDRALPCIFHPVAFGYGDTHFFPDRPTPDSTAPWWNCLGAARDRVHRTQQSQRPRPYALAETPAHSSVPQAMSTMVTLNGQFARVAKFVKSYVA